MNMGYGVHGLRVEVETEANTSKTYLVDATNPNNALAIMRRHFGGSYPKMTVVNYLDVNPETLQAYGVPVGGCAPIRT